MVKHVAGAALVMALALTGSGRAGAQSIASYFESSATQKPRTDAGLSVESDRLHVKADVAMRAPGGVTTVVPQVSSVFAINDRLGLETHINLAEWNTGAKLLQATYATSLRFRPSVPFLEELEGQVWRSPDGQSKETVRAQFYQTLRPADQTPALTVRARAVFESATGPSDPFGTQVGRPETHRFGLETVIGGFLSGLLRGQNALSLKLERISGATAESAKSLAFNHAWTLPNLSQLGFNVRMLRASQTTAGRLEPSVGFSWHTRL
jgi:hypothetical protein